MEIFEHLGIGKQAKHYDVYINTLLEIGTIVDATPDKKRGKRYIATERGKGQV